MIIDQIKNAGCYYTVHSGIRQALEYLAETDFPSMVSGRQSIDGERIYATIDAYQTKPRETARWEAHRRYIDVQYIVSGIEIMGYAPVQNLQAIDDYDASKDCIRLTGKGDFMTVPAGSFIIFFPQDGHMPCLAVDSPAHVRKVVVKVEAGDISF